ncbi:MAG: DUF4268 domain-containing protein [Bacteroidales bacterium]|jgi:hypothetical protein|nr:DUF4268 domain-containing protein [Bacteroidales bacterium]
MYSKEEVKRVRLEFWEGFRKYSTPRRRKMGKNRAWMLEKTGIKAINMKFEITNEEALAGIAVYHRDKYIEGLYYEKFESLRGILRNGFGDRLIWQPDYRSEEGRIYSYIYVEKQDVGIYRPDTWNIVYEFFFDNMMKFEDIFTEYKDFVREIEE